MTYISGSLLIYDSYNFSCLNVTLLFVFWAGIFGFSLKRSATQIRKFPSFAEVVSQTQMVADVVARVCGRFQSVVKFMTLLERGRRITIKAIGTAPAIMLGPVLV